MVFSVQNEKRSPFLMEIEDVFAAKDRGTVVSGHVKSGNALVGDEVEIIGLLPTIQRAAILEKDVLYKGNIVLTKLTKDDLILLRGQVVATPGTMKPYTRFLAHISFFASETPMSPQPFLGTFRSSLYIRNMAIYSTLWLPEGTSHLLPGDQMDGEIELQVPSALEIGLSFRIGRNVGHGTVVKLLNEIPPTEANLKFR